MYFLDKLCRICVRPGALLISLDTVDCDLIKLSEKLEICANLTISSEDIISSAICEKCLNKLRISYNFLHMCKKSTKLIQGYFSTIRNQNLNDESRTECSVIDNNSELYTEIEKLPLDLNNISVCYTSAEENCAILQEEKNQKIIKRKQRITKGQRCSLLQQLLNKSNKERENYLCYSNSNNNSENGLKSILNFTKNYEFSFPLDKYCQMENTPLDKLTAFAKNYFTRDFTDFKNYILDVIENQNISNSSSSDNNDEECLSDYEETLFDQVRIKIKKEYDEDEEENVDERQCPLDYLETFYDDEKTEDIKVKTEFKSDDSEDEETTANNNNNDFPEDLSIKSTLCENYHLNGSPSAVKLLDRLVSKYPLNTIKNKSRITREQPYNIISPLLKNQFLNRSFKCEKCNRYFKTQGYLKAHRSKKNH